MNDDEVDALLVQIRHRDAVRILIASAAVGLPLLVAAVIGVDWGGFWDQVLSGVLGLSAFGAATAALHLRRNRALYARVIAVNGKSE